MINTKMLMVVGTINPNIIKTVLLVQPLAERPLKRHKLFIISHHPRVLQVVNDSNVIDLATKVI